MQKSSAPNSSGESVTSGISVVTADNLKLEPRVIVIGVAMDYAELAEAPSSFDNPRAAVVVAKEYNRAARACRELRNFILSQGYFAKAYQGPYATALNFLPAAIAAGLGELGKHGSLINREYGSSNS